MKKVYPNELLKTDAIKCQCGCGQNFLNLKLVQNLNELAECIFLSLPISTNIERICFYITSWNRCEKHNKKVGGAKNSLHQTGNAIDFVVAIVENHQERVVPGKVVAWMLENIADSDDEIIVYEADRLHYGIKN